MGSSNFSSNADHKPSKNNNLLLIILAIFAIGGIGFGIYELIQLQSKNDQIAALESEVSKLKQSIEESNKAATDAEIEIGGIVIDEWNLKIEVPKTIAISSYTLNNETSLSIIGAPINDKQNKATIGLYKVKKAEVESGNAQMTSLDKAVFTDDHFAYYLMYTNTTPQRDMTIDEIVYSALSDSKLYSKIR